MDQEAKEWIKDWIKMWLGITAVIAILAFSAGVFVEYLNLPVVYKSHRTGKAVAVMTKDGVETHPKTLPKKYELVWVE